MAETPEDENATEHARQLRHRDLLEAIGTSALRNRDLDQLLSDAAQAVADGMRTPFAKVLEYLPTEHKLLVRAGVGWHEGVVGHAKLGADTESPAGFALHTSTPVISHDLATDERFRTPQLLLDHGIHRAINVIIKGDGVPFGVLEADGRATAGFMATDVGFLQAAANLLGVAVERSRRESELEAALAAGRLLLREADHRIKNSLQLVASLLSMQRTRLSDTDSKAALDDAISRVRAIAEAHRALFQSSDPSRVALGRMMTDIVAYVQGLSTAVTLSCGTDETLEIDAERGIPLALIVNELLTNAVRHAYPDDAPGTVSLTAQRDGDAVRITIADAGRGIDSNAPPSRTLGSTIVAALARQIGLHKETVSRPNAGTTIVLVLPMAAASDS